MFMAIQEQIFGSLFHLDRLLKAIQSLINRFGYNTHFMLIYFDTL